MSIGAAKVAEEPMNDAELRMHFKVSAPALLEGVFTRQKYDLERLLYLCATLLDAGVSVEELTRRLVPRSD